MLQTHTKQSPSILKDLLTANKEWFSLPMAGDMVKGTVIGKESGILYVDLDDAGIGMIYGKEYAAIHDIIKNLQKGDVVTAKLVELENEFGLRELSMKKTGDEKNWQSLKELKDKKETTDVKVLDANKGGLIVQAGTISGFLPVSQLTPAHYPRVEGGNKAMILEELQKFIGQKFIVRVLDIDAQEGKIIFSEKAAEDDKIKSALSQYHIGDVVEGTISGIVNFGVFVKFDDLLEGLIHISEIDWNLVTNPSSMFKVSEKVSAKIVDITQEGRISLSIKAMKNDPWSIIDQRFSVDDEIKREVVKINSYGALVKIDDGIQGLVHVSEFPSEKVMNESLEKDKEYTFKIKSIEPQNRKISLMLV